MGANVNPTTKRSIHDIPKSIAELRSDQWNNVKSICINKH